MRFCGQEYGEGMSAIGMIDKNMRQKNYDASSSTLRLQPQVALDASRSQEKLTQYFCQLNALNM
jgi:hypothetical protein